ncbi:molecular chaperone DnaK [Candidatus Bathycorpusculum sp.]|uniref:molecular chaperone DnaK n=1 Tax=Candidatus Bathycorpusculum sp. TaxID=2994959 RepID=UPI00281FD23B|nr:molecular chaperone DnaK [Candidatus Termitimicrobium sp.]MCL2431516.1 molecular chaperone DnaK [Candidatus Termitimicrobium sp.]
MSTQKSNQKVLGIDLGTTNSAAAIYEGGHATVIPSAEGPTMAGKMFPSVVAFTKDGQLLVGEPAKRQATTNPEGTIFEIKRKMGTNYKADIYGKQYSPQQISAFILQKIKKDAETYLGGTINKAVITVPAHFDDNQRQATKDAGEIAGFEVMRIINEPTAACLAYGIDKLEHEMKILVFSFGGGTHDVTLMDFGKGVFQVLSTSGDTQLGGTDVDKAIMDYILEEFKRQTGVNVSNDRMAMSRLKDAAEKAKIELSTLMSTDIDLPFLTADASGPKHLHLTLTRTKLESLAQPIVEKTKPTLLKALEDAKLNPQQVDKIILIGGMTRMPLVQRFVEQILGKAPERGIDPMESVAIGAAIQAGVVTGEVTDLLLLDVTPLSLGVETMGGVMTKVLDKNTTIPTKRSQVFSTAADFQTAVTIHVLQGERTMSSDNVSLGEFNLVDLPPAPRGVPQIEVTFDIDANGILNVTAKDRGTGKQAKITITASTKLSKEEKDRLINEAEQFADQDRKKKEEAETRNTADSLIYTAERTKNDLAGKISTEETAKIDTAITELKNALASNDTAQMKAKSDELQKVLQDIGTKVYQQAAAEAAKQQQAQGQAGPQPGTEQQPPPASGPESRTSDENVVDAEDYKVK